MASSDPSSKIRHRQTKGTKIPTSETIDNLDEDSATGISLLDVLRVLAGILLLNSLLSYYVTSADSFFWNYRPRWARPGILKSYIVGCLSE
jgi:hypothetical protein